MGITTSYRGGDMDGDRDLDGSDMATFADAFGSFLGDANYNADADLDVDLGIESIEHPERFPLKAK